MTKRSGAVLLSAAIFAASLTAGTALGAESGSGAGSGEPARSETVDMKMQVQAERFRARGGRVYARGPMTLRASRSDGTTETIRRSVRMRVKAAGKGRRSCKIINLHLATLQLDLLGLIVKTSEVNLQVKGVRGKALGNLFCRLAKGVKLKRKRVVRQTARSLNRRLDGEGMNVLSFGATLRTQQAEQPDGEAQAAAPSGPVCRVLDLDLGPLELDLLGLFVHLYGKNKKSPVHVDADADPNGGVLGELLCAIAAEPEPQREPQAQP